MTTVLVTLNFDSIAEAQAALDRLHADPHQATIAFADRPDTGVSAEEKTAVLGFNPFATAEAAVAQVPPSPPAAPSTAVVAAPPTAPVAPSGISIPLPVPQPPAPLPVPAAPAPAAPAALTNPAGIEVDKDGLPWDARIHAGGRAVNADGRWRQKRGLNNDALKAAVETELRLAMGAPAAPSVPQPPAPLPVPPAPTVAETFATLMARVGPRLMAGQITEAQSLAVLAELGLQSYTQLIARPDLVPAAAARYDALVPVPA